MAMALFFLHPLRWWTPFSGASVAMIWTYVLVGEHRGRNSGSKTIKVRIGIYISHQSNSNDDVNADQEDSLDWS